MHPARAKAKQTQALVETAASVETINARLDAIEAKLDEALSLLKPEPTKSPTSTKKGG